MPSDMCSPTWGNTYPYEYAFLYLGKQNNRHKIAEGEKKEDGGMANNRESW